MYRFPQIRLLVFAKAPVPGQVKTRLIPVLSAQQAAELHGQLVHDTLRRVSTHRLCPVSLYCAPDVEHPFFKDLLRNFPVELHGQRDGDLGVRMAQAVEETLAQGQWPILVGTDCPLLDSTVLASACETLQQGGVAVLVPAEDGGYVLLGLRERAPSLFQGIDWGSSRVLDQTRNVFRDLGWHWRELARLWDLDRPADLIRYQQQILGRK